MDVVIAVLLITATLVITSRQKIIIENLNQLNATQQLMLNELQQANRMAESSQAALFDIAKNLREPGRDSP